MYKAIIAIGIAAAACLAVGCGSSSDETAEAAVTKAQFVKEAEAICANTQEEGRNVRIAWEKANGEEMDFETTAKRVIGPTMKQQAEALRALDGPKEDAAKLARMIDNLSKGAAGLTAEGPQSKSTSKFEAFQREANAYGLEVCAL